MNEIDRRIFLKFGASLLIGGVVGEAMLPIKNSVNDMASRLTGYTAGNAQVIKDIELQCGDAENPEDCYRSYNPPTGDVITAVIVAPPLEEFIFRAIPSLIVNEMENDYDKAYSDITSGTWSLSTSRRELFVGAISSIIFGAAHNVTKEGFDLRNIPASQTLGGIVYWFLQRKFGISSNIVAHSWNNFRAMTMNR